MPCLVFYSGQADTCLTSLVSAASMSEADCFTDTVRRELMAIPFSVWSTLVSVFSSVVCVGSIPADSTVPKDHTRDDPASAQQATISGPPLVGTYKRDELPRVPDDIGPIIAEMDDMMKITLAKHSEMIARLRNVVSLVDELGDELFTGGLRISAVLPGLSGPIVYTASVRKYTVEVKPEDMKPALLEIGLMLSGAKAKLEDAKSKLEDAVAWRNRVPCMSDVPMPDIETVVSSATASVHELVEARWKFFRSLVARHETLSSLGEMTVDVTVMPRPDRGESKSKSGIWDWVKTAAQALADHCAEFFSDRGTGPDFGFTAKPHEAGCTGHSDVSDGLHSVTEAGDSTDGMGYEKGCSELHTSAAEQEHQTRLLEATALRDEAIAKRDTKAVMNTIASRDSRWYSSRPLQKRQRAEREHALKFAHVELTDLRLSAMRRRVSGS